MKVKVALTLSILIVLFFLFSSCSKEDKKTQNNTSATIDFFLDWSPGPDYIGFYVSSENGYYTEEGLNINIRGGNGAEQAATLLKSDAIKIGTTTVDALVRQEFKQQGTVGKSDLSKGEESPRQSPRIAATIFVTNPVVLVTQKDRPIYKLDDLSGLKIGYSEETSVTYSQFKILLEQNLALKEKINLVKVGWNGPQEFQAGTVDGVLAYATDVPPELKMRGIPFNIRRLSDFGMTVPGQCVAISPKADIPHDVLLRFLKASVRGWEFARNNPEKAADLFVAKFPGQDKEKTLESIKYTVELLPPILGDQSLSAYTSKENIKTQVESAIKVLASVIDPKGKNEEWNIMVDKLVYTK